MSSFPRPIAATKAESPKAERIRVFLRSRPLTADEVRGKDSIAASVNPATASVVLANRVKDAPAKEYGFDGVFTENSDQKHVYDTVVAPAVRMALEGFNCTVFAYGQTGTGKTFTMEGGLEGGAAWSAEHPESGMIPRAVRDVFAHLEGNMDSENSVRVSHMELFNEELIDLLGGSDDKPLRLFEHPKEGVTVHNLEQVPVTSADAIFKILRKSSIKRQEAATKMNASSSRSHCIFTITVHTKEATGDGGELIRIGRLNLIDLAGSENVAKSGTMAGEQKREAGVINQSLLVLGRVLVGASENRQHIPYRESKLTRIMADAIGGKTRTSMIACITPAASSYDETQATLDYAAAARKIKNRPELNAKITKKAVIKDYLNEIERLKMQVTAAREKNGVYLSPEEFKQMQDQIKAGQESVTRLEEQLVTRNKQLDDLTSVHTSTADRLRETADRLQATDADLQETRGALGDTQATLEQTQDALEEHGAVLRHREQTEKALHANATAILSTLGVRERDVEGLHAKVARKAAVEEDNRKIKSAFRDYVAAKVEDMNGQLKRFRSAQSAHYASVAGAVRAFMEEKTSDMDKLCEKLDAMQALLQDTQARMSAAVSTHADEAQADLAAVQQSTAANRTRVAQLLAQHVATSNAALDEWRAQLAEQRALVSEWGVNTAAAIQVAIDTGDEWSAAHTTDLHALRAALDLNTKASLAWAEEHRRSVEGALRAHKERADRMQREMFRQVSDLVCSYVATQQKALAANVASLQEATAAQQQALAAQHDARARTIEQSAVPAVEARNKKLHGELDALCETVTAHCEGETRRIAKDEGRADKWQGGADTLRETQVALQSAAGTRFERAADVTCVAWDTAATQQQTRLDELAAQTGMWRDEATEHEMVSRSSIDETQQAVEAKIKALEVHAAKFGDALNSELGGVQDQFHHYFDSLRTDAPTGDTPLKRVVPHPTAFPRSLPDDQIVAEHVRRKQQQQLPSSFQPTTLLLGSTVKPRSPADATADAFTEFADFAAEDRAVPSSSDTTPSQQQQHAVRQTSSSSLKLTMTAQRSSSAAPSAASSDPVADKRAAVKAQRQQQQQQQQQQDGKLARQGSANNGGGKLAAVGPQRTALAPLNRPNAAGAK